MKQHFVFVGSILIGLAAFFLTHQYLRSERAKLYAGAERIKVVVAARDLPAGAAIQVEDLAQKSVFKSAVGENVILPRDVDLVLNKKLRYGLKRQEPLWWSHVEMPQGLRSGLSPIIKKGLRAMSIAIGGDAAVSGLVQPNDRVDILGTFTLPARGKPGVTETVTMTLLQDVTVLATGQRLARQDFEEPDPWTRGLGGYSTITLEVTPFEAEILTFAQNVQGRLTLALRHPEDTGFEKELPQVNADGLESHLPQINQHRQRILRHKTDG